jgi:hypothetical protein
MLYSIETVRPGSSGYSEPVCGNVAEEYFAMKRFDPRSIFAACAVATTIAGVCCGISSPASAVPYNPITWDVSGTFDDGGTFSGAFTLNVYGYLASGSITTTLGTTLPGTTYNVVAVPHGGIIPGTPPADGIDLYVGYGEILQIVFTKSLETLGTDLIVVGLNGPSFECYSFSCPPGGADGVTTRYIATGSAVATPLPSTWTMMLAGLGGLGFFAYRATKNRRPAVAAA